jgi:hypothetical protein
VTVGGVGATDESVAQSKSCEGKIRLQWPLQVAKLHCGADALMLQTVGEQWLQVDRRSQ